MKESKYNYYLDYKGDVLWFNGISHKFFTLKKDLSEKIRNNLNILKDLSPSFYEKLCANQFIVDDEVDEIEIIRNETIKSRKAKDYFLILIPTLNCNFNCWYCVQDHKESLMKDVAIEKVKNHLEYMIREEHISSLHIEWFGGEPFMYFEKVIVDISKYAIQLCDNANIPFTNTATTNGYYLVPSIVAELEELRFVRFQITIDGDRSQHNKVKKCEESNSTFDSTLGNIDNLLAKTNTIEVMLRLNYHDGNLSEKVIDDVNKLIREDVRSKIYILLRRIWQVNTSFERSVTIRHMFEVFRKSGYRFSDIDVENNLMHCFTDKKYYNAINYDGGVLKCTANGDLELESSPGFLKDNGDVEWKDGFLDKYYKLRYENEMCLKCKHLPLCMGNCARDYKLEDQNDFKYSCVSSVDLNFKDIIYNYCENNS
jgi:uncharacterized protein